MSTTHCVPQIRLGFHPDRPIDLSFDAPATSSDGGFLLLGMLDSHRGTTASLASTLRDQRDPLRIEHSLPVLIRQRVLQIAAGYEDAIDADSLRVDPLLRLACERPADGAPLASQPTLSRLENAVSLREVVRAQRAHERRWVENLPADLDKVVLDIDGTCDPTHGQQQLSFFNGFYDTTMYAPLLVFDQFGALASARLRSGRHHLHNFAAPLIERLVRLVRRERPNTMVVVRADAAFGQAAVINRLWRLRKELGAVEMRIGITPNSAIKRGARVAIDVAQRDYEATGESSREYDTIIYQSETWDVPLWVALRAECGDGRPDVRGVIYSNPIDDPRYVYDELYALRGDAENRIKDFKRALMGDRLSCHRFAANALRLQLHAAAYELMHALRTLAQRHDSGPRPQFDTFRRRLLKVSATVRRSARRCWIALPAAFPAAGLFRALAEQLEALLQRAAVPRVAGQA